MDTPILTKKRLASEVLAAGHSEAMVRAMCGMGRYVDDCGMLAGAAPLLTVAELARSAPVPFPSAPAPALAQSGGSFALAAIPLVGEGMRATPNALLRGALFAAIQGKDRRALKREVLASLEGIEIRFTGWQLDQSDLDVWETIVHLAQHHILGEPVFFSAHQILTALGRCTGKSDHEWLKGSFARLASGCCEIKIGGYSFFGALLTGEREEATGRYRIDPQPRLLSLYRAGWTAIDWHERQKLKRKPLALWLYSWFCSHAAPYPLKVDTIHRLSGSRNESLPKFRYKLGQALDDLQVVGAIESWTISADDLVEVVRAGCTASQMRHLARKAKVAKPKTARRGLATIGELVKPK